MVTPSIFDIFLKFHIGIFAVLGPFYLIYELWMAVNHRFFCDLYGLIPISYILFYGLYKFARKLERKNAEVSIARSRRYLLLGMAEICFAAWIPRLIVFLYPLDQLAGFLSIFMTFPAIGYSYYYYVVGAKKEFQITYTTTQKLPWIILAINVVLLIALLIIGFRDPAMVLWVHLGYFTTCSVSMIEFCQVLKGNLEKVNNSHLVHLMNPLVLRTNDVCDEKATRHPEVNKKTIQQFSNQLYDV